MTTTKTTTQVADATESAPVTAPAVTPDIIAADAQQIAADLDAGKGVSDFITAHIRTGVPVVVGLIVEFFASRGLNFHGWDTLLSPVLAAAASFAWYFTVRALEHKWPKLGWLLGVPAKPTYS